MLNNQEKLKGLHDMDQLYKDCRKDWNKKFSDHRYLKYPRWAYIKKTIDQFRVKTILEFGCGLSTILFDQLGCKVDSFETDQDYMKSVDSMIHTRNVNFFHWNNQSSDYFKKLEKYHMALVDGALPRTRQLNIAAKYSDIIIIDDININRPIDLPDWVRIDSITRFIGVFVRRLYYAA